MPGLSGYLIISYTLLYYIILTCVYIDSMVSSEFSVSSFHWIFNYSWVPINSTIDI